MVAKRRMRAASPETPPQTLAVYRRALDALDAARVPYLVGGGLAMNFYAAVERDLKDVDLHLLPSDVPAARRALEAAGFSTTIRHPQWLAQAHGEGCQICLIFGAGTWLDCVDGAWFARSRPGKLWGRVVRYAPPEEIFCQKISMCSRVRFDGSDAYHLLLGTRGRLDWDAVLARADDQWEVLLAQLLFFRYVYPDDADLIPDAVLDRLLARLQAEREEQRGAQTPRISPTPLCRGKLLDGSGPYEQAVRDWGYRDARAEQWEISEAKRQTERLAQAK